MDGRHTGSLNNGAPFFYQNGHLTKRLVENAHTRTQHTHKLCLASYNETEQECQFYVPADVALTKVFYRRCLLDEALDLVRYL